MQNAQKSPAIVLKSPPVALRCVNNLGYIVRFRPPISFRRGQPYLLKIRGVNLRNIPTIEVTQNYLKGAPGSTIHIGVVDYAGKTEEIDLFIPLKEKVNGMFSPEEFYSSIDRFNGEEPHPNLTEKTQTNNDLIVKGYCSDLAKTCSESEENQRNTLTTIFQCIAVSQAIGDLGAADKFLRQTLSALQDNSSAPIRTLNFPFSDIIKNLIALGQEKEAVAICQKLASPAYQESVEHLDPCKILECLSTIPTKESYAVQTELIERLYLSYSREQSPSSQNQLWFGQLLEGRDKTPERALNIYSIEEKKLRKVPDPQPSFTSCQKLAACLYLKAQAESKLGDTEQAAKDLSAITDYFKTNLPTAQFALLDQLPLYFPAPSDIAAAQAALAKSQPIKALPPITCEPWYESSSRGKPAETVPSIALQFPQTKGCFTAIARGEQSKAIALAQQLLGAYKREGNNEEEIYSRIRQNLFCTTMRIARAFADKGWIADSDHLLKQLTRTISEKDLDPGWVKIANLMIATEELVNSLSNKELNNKSWEEFENNYLDIKTNGRSVDAKRISFNYERCKRLRLLAMNYTFADEHRRAKVFYDRALLVEPDIITDQEASGRIDRQLTERFSLRINRAMLAIKIGEYSDADRYIKLAKEQKPTPSQDVIRSLAKTADAFNEAGQTNRSIDLMKNILTTKLSDQYYRAAQIKSKLAALLFKKGTNLEAIKLVEQTTTPGSSGQSASNYTRAAQVAEKSGNYTEAARYYSLAGNTFNQRDAKAQAIPLLRQAIACIEREKNFDKDLLATYYISLADKSGALETASIKLREKAISLMSDTNPKKPEEIRTTAYLRRESIKEALPRELRNKQPPYVYKDTDTLKARIAMEPQPTSDELESNLQAATLAARNKLPDVGDYWMRLANSEALAKKFDLACTHARLAIAAYKKGDPRSSKREQIIGSNGVAVFLAVAGAPELGKILFREAIARVQEVQGPSSLAAQMQLAQYFDFCVGEKDSVSSLGVLDELLATDLNQGTYGPPSPGVSICTFGAPIPIRSSFEAISIINTTISDCFKRKDFALGNLVAEKLIAAERKQFPPGDYRTAVTIEIQARGYADAGDYTRAEALYREAKPVLVKHGEWFYKSDGNYRKVLQAVNKQDEVDKMDADAFSDRAEIIKKEEERQTNALYPTR
ncbi:MAG: hypothetical protein WCT03_09005 [Candidatus Obscuribacterales bacterium]